MRINWGRTVSTKLERILGICFEVNRGRYPSCDDLCNEYGIKSRTLYDDLVYIRDRLRFDIKFDRSKGGYYNADPNKKLPAFELFENELLAITMGSDMLQSRTGKTFKPQIEQAIDKIAERLPRYSREIEEFRALIRFRSAGIAPVTPDIWFTLKRACEERRKVDILYFTAYTGKEQWRTINPYILIEHNGAWYAPAYCNLRNENRLFALHRIRECNISDETFQIEKGFDVQKWVDEAFLLEHGDGEQRIVIKFNPVGARYAIERKLHPTQTIQTHPDGSITMEFIAHNLNEVKRWVLTYGASAEVLEPAELRRRVKEEFVEALRAYGS